MSGVKRRQKLGGDRRHVRRLRQCVQGHAAAGVIDNVHQCRVQQPLIDRGLQQRIVREVPVSGILIKNDPADAHRIDPPGDLGGV